MVKSKIQSLFYILIPDKYKEEFDLEVNKINVSRSKVTSVVFIAIGILMVISSYVISDKKIFEYPDVFFTCMYAAILIIMVSYLFVFRRIRRKELYDNETVMKASVTFSFFIVLWCSILAMLDQYPYGGIIIYILGIMAIAVIPLYKPTTLLAIYVAPQIIFMIGTPLIHQNTELLLGHYLNTLSALFFSWYIGRMLYISKVKDFLNGKIIQDKNIQLNYANSELAIVNKELKRLSITDALTGLYNRRKLNYVLDKEWDRCKRYFMPISIIMIDIDYFKLFNDNYGHQEGDICLEKVAKVISNAARRSSDLVARWGGEEFVVLLPYADSKMVLDRAEKIRQDVEDLNIKHEYSKVSNIITISLGINTVIPSNKCTIFEFISCADKALYKAKAKNCNQVKVYGED